MPASPTIEDARPGEPDSSPPLARVTKLLLVVLVFSLASMQPLLWVAGSFTVGSDLIFVALALAWAGSLLLGHAKLRWNRAYWLLAFYFGAQVASALATGAPLASAGKLATQIYLLSLPVIVNSLVDDVGDLRRLFRAWLAGTAVVATVAFLSLLLFAVDPANPLLDYTRYHFGTLPPGGYLRLKSTFQNANMLCNYLTVALLLLLAAHRLAWVSRTTFGLLLAGLLLTAILTISPGLGGIALAGGGWLWLALKEKRPAAARLCLAAGLIPAILAIPAMAVTPIVHPTAPYLIHPPGLDAVLAPSGRLMTWTAAAKEFLDHPLLGHGIGNAAVHVRYLSPAGERQLLLDAHNSFLSLAAQCGLAGVAALLLLLAFCWRRTLPLSLLPGNANVARLALGLAFLNGLAYQGLGGSFEDARHLWIAFGLFLASVRLEGATPRAQASPVGR
jgi:O-antigen ligase